MILTTANTVYIFYVAFAHRSALRGGTAVTFPIGFGLTAGGIITRSPPLEALGCAPRAGLRGRGLWGGVEGALACCSDAICTTTGNKNLF